MIVFYDLKDIDDELMLLISVDELYRDKSWNPTIIGLIDVTDLSDDILYRPRYYIEHNDRQYMFATIASVLDKFEQDTGPDVVVKIDRRVLGDLL